MNIIEIIIDDNINRELLPKYTFVNCLGETEIVDILDIIQTGIPFCLIKDEEMELVHITIMDKNDKS